MELLSEKIGFYGAGNMGHAIIKGLIDSNLYRPEDIIVFDVYQPTLDRIQQELGVTVSNEEREVAKAASTLVLAVKPTIIPSVLEKIDSVLTESHLIISIAAGVTIQRLSENVSNKQKFARAMPNTPALIGEGMSAISVNEEVTAEDKDKIFNIFTSFGEAEFVAEYLMDAVVGVSGSAPAYIYMFIEALADGAVLAGMPRASAYKFAAQTVLGSAKMVKETGKHPGELKDMVCSPGGTTIAAVSSLEANHFRATVMEAVQAASEKNKLM